MNTSSAPSLSAQRMAISTDRAASEQGFDAGQGLRYGALGFALAFVALPLYVLLPNYYATQFGVSLLSLGALLLLARLLDAVIDPALGRLVDRLFARSQRMLLLCCAGAAALLVLGFVALFFPPRAWQTNSTDLLLWAGAALVLTYSAYSFISVAHQAWGAMLGGNEERRSRIVAWREGFALAGVVVASVTPTALGLPTSTVIFAISLLLGLWLWSHSAPPSTVLARQAQNTHSVWRPFANDGFRRLLAIFVVNGIASAVPATLVLFFVQDRLQAPDALQGLFLGSYFACAAASMPLWLKAVARWGLARSWAAGMWLAIAVFAFATQIGAGDVAAFVVICALSGVALGADLALPPALLAGVIARAGDRGQHEGAYFGWWNFCNKLNLALAAGLALPLLAAFSYTPGVREPQALQALVIAYCVLPCVLKAIAAVLVWRLWINKEEV